MTEPQSKSQERRLAVQREGDVGALVSEAKEWLAKYEGMGVVAGEDGVVLVSRLLSALEESRAREAGLEQCLDSLLETGDCDPEFLNGFLARRALEPKEEARG